jgi:hypothetical protein
MVDRDRFHFFYLSAKRVYRQDVDLAKQEANMAKIKFSTNPYRAACGLVNGSLPSEVLGKSGRFQ